MLCALSGEAPQVPVASRKSGAIFEKRLIESYIAENGRDPTTSEELTTDDLLELKSSRVVKPRPPTLTSIPSLLSVFQNEWDAMALETYSLRQQLSQTRQELSTALYQHDAAVRVIARLTREREEARDALSKVTVGPSAAATNGDRMQVDSQALPDEMAAKVQATQEKLSKTRRKRPVPEDWATTETIQHFQPGYTSMALHPGGRSIALDPTGDLVILGGGDGSAGIHSISQNKLVQALEGGQGQVTDTLWWESRAIIATASGQVIIFEDGASRAQFTSHSGRAAALALHPSGELLASVGVDKSYVFYDLSSLKPITQIFLDADLTTAAFHPDGHLFAAGTSRGQIKIFDVRSGAHAADLDASGAIQSLSFSENGTWLASASAGQSRVTIWNLRTAAALRDLEMGGPVSSVRWDYTGQFLAAAGPSGITVQSYSKATKEWSEPLRSAVPSVAIQWGPQARSLMSVNGAGVVTVLREGE
ncbi:MAG: hypothetical protein M1823_001849 [Watsoniomyces obsoletus]|nr:MAG: hypothetical protein M1823_001849 [Watsoniomyces obsoletus]